jgi:hypothetical protein
MGIIVIVFISSCNHSGNVNDYLVSLATPIEAKDLKTLDRIYENLEQYALEDLLLVYDRMLYEEGTMSTRIKQSSLWLIAKNGDESTIDVLFDLARKDPFIDQDRWVTHLVSNQPPERIIDYLSKADLGEEDAYLVDNILQTILMLGYEFSAEQQAQIDVLASSFKTAFDFLPQALKDVEKGFVENRAVTLSSSGIAPFTFFPVEAVPVAKEEYDRKQMPVVFLKAEALKEHIAPLFNRYLELGEFSMSGGVSPEKILFSVHRTHFPDHRIGTLKLTKLPSYILYSALCYKSSCNLALSRMTTWKTMAGLAHLDITNSNVDLIEQKINEFDWYRFNCDEKKWFFSSNSWGIVGIHHQYRKFSIMVYN